MPIALTPPLIHGPLGAITLWVLDISASDVFFPIDIEVNKTVGHLKNKILKDNTSHIFTNVNADELTLWMVSTSVLTT